MERYQRAPAVTSAVGYVDLRPKGVPVAAVERTVGVLTDEVDGRTFLIDQAGTQVIELNAVGSVVWAAIDGTRDIDDLVVAVRQGCAGTDQESPARVRLDVVAFLDELRRLELVTQ